MIFMIATIGSCVEISEAQTIPFGRSIDTVFAAPDDHDWQLYYYKPASFNPATSPILWYIHGTGGTGIDGEQRLMDIAERRSALIVSPTIPGAYRFAYDLSPIDGEQHWFPEIFAKIYRHVITREDRDTMWVHLTGFSAGGQCVTRYMLVRQMIPDSIPIRMAVSVSPLYYTFATDTFNNYPMMYACGLHQYCNSSYCFGEIEIDWDMPYNCGSHVRMYYQENYGVMVGKYDTTATSSIANCVSAQGPSGRLDKARTFYGFSQSDATTRGVTLRWPYEEVPGVGHNSFAMYSTMESPTDSSTIAETMLFDSPYQKPVVFPPTAEFDATVSDEYCTVYLRPNCIINHLPTTFYWDFGDGNTSSEVRPRYTYSDTGTYKVSLAITNAAGTDTSSRIIIVDKLPPLADFYTDTNIVSLGNAIRLYNISNGGDYFYWDFGDSTTSTEKNPVHTYLYADTFAVTLIAVNGNNGCANEISKTIIVKLPDGFPENSFVASLHVFPNPAKDFVNIRFVLPERSNVQFDLYNVTGQFIRSVYSGYAVASAVNTIRLATDDLPGGLYLGMLSTSRGRKMVKILVSD